jgi:predicted esterase
MENRSVMLARAGVVLLLSTIAFAEEPIRTWTSNKGTKLEARLREYDGITITLDGGGQTYAISPNALCKADQLYLKSYAENALKEREAQLAKERAERLANTKRGTYILTLEAKMFLQGEDYYSTSIGQSVYKSLRKQGKDPLALVGYAPTNERATVYVPAHYDGENAFGIYVHISAGDGPSMPNYNSVVDARDMIMASPFGGGNKEEPMRRVMLALDTVATLKKKYRIDGANIYVGGISGGGITAMEAQLTYPDIWAGTVSHARGMNLGNFGEYYSESKEFDRNDFKRMSKMKQRFAVISGPKDFNYKHCQDSTRHWKHDGFDIRFFDVPDMGHENAPATEFEKALDWVRKEGA